MFSEIVSTFSLNTLCHSGQIADHSKCSFEYRKTPNKRPLPINAPPPPPIAQNVSFLTFWLYLRQKWSDFHSVKSYLKVKMTSLRLSSLQTPMGIDCIRCFTVHHKISSVFITTFFIYLFFWGGGGATVLCNKVNLHTTVKNNSHFYLLRGPMDPKN